MTAALRISPLSYFIWIVGLFFPAWAGVNIPPRVWVWQYATLWASVARMSNPGKASFDEEAACRTVYGDVVC